MDDTILFEHQKVSNNNKSNKLGQGIHPLVSIIMITSQKILSRLPVNKTNSNTYNALCYN